MVLREGQPARRLRQPGARGAEGERHAAANPAAVASEGDRRAGPEVDSSPQLEGPRRVARRRQRPSRRRDRARSARSSSSRVDRASWSRTRPAGPRSRRPSSTGTSSASSMPEIARRVPAQREDLLHRRGASSSCFALLARGDPQPAGAGLLPAARARDRLRRPLPRRADDPRDRAARLRRAGARSSPACRPRPSFWGIVALVLVYTAYVSEVYRAGIESVHPSQEVGGPLARPHARRRRCAS